MEKRSGVLLWPGRAADRSPDAWVILLGLLALPVMYPYGNLQAIDAYFFGASAATESGLNTYDCKELALYQQLYIYFIPLITNLGFINILVVLVRLHWFRKRIDKIGHALLAARRQRFTPDQAPGSTSDDASVDLETGVESRRPGSAGAETGEKAAPLRIQDASAASSDGWLREKPGAATSQSAGPDGRTASSGGLEDRQVVPVDASTDTDLSSRPGEDAQSALSVHLAGSRDTTPDSGRGASTRSAKSLQDEKRVSVRDGEACARAGQCGPSRDLRRSRHPLRRILGKASAVLRLRSKGAGGCRARTEYRCRASGDGTARRLAGVDGPDRLTAEDRDELGGVEYRSLKLLLKIITAYFFGVHLLGGLGMLGWVQYADPKYRTYLAEQGLNKSWW
ncbi:hypothetical protein CDD83_506 [Cordyceps sp. RAO-2017]|nr:hypothetical protein CDD83_506 [Cordyceps sp. RAO-2017]